MCYQSINTNIWSKYYLGGQPTDGESVSNMRLVTTAMRANVSSVCTFLKINIGSFSQYIDPEASNDSVRGCIAMSIVRQCISITQIDGWWRSSTNCLVSPDAIHGYSLSGYHTATMLFISHFWVVLLLSHSAMKSLWRRSERSKHLPVENREVC